MVLFKREFKTIRVSDDIYRELARIQGRLQLQRGRRVTFSDAVKYLLEKYDG